VDELQEFEVTLTVTVTVEARDWAHAVDEARDYVMWSGAELDAVEPFKVDRQQLIHIPLDGEFHGPFIPYCAVNNPVLDAPII